jgi:hypothetical protein
MPETAGSAVFIDNDATVAALAEADDEQLLPVGHNLVMLTIGTGVGGGLVVGGRIYRGATGGVGELGHTIVALPLSEGGVPAANGVPAAGIARVPRVRSRIGPSRSGARRPEPPPPRRSAGSVRMGGRSLVPTRCRPLAAGIGSRPGRSRSGPSVWVSGLPMRSRSTPMRSGAGAGGACRRAAPEADHAGCPGLRAPRRGPGNGEPSRTPRRPRGCARAALLARHELEEA